jgi:hypothetical protein
MLLGKVKLIKAMVADDYETDEDMYDIIMDDSNPV